MPPTSPPAVIAAAAFALAACGGRDAGGLSAAGVNRDPVAINDSGPSGTCTQPDASVNGCTAARALLSCGQDGGESEICLSDNLVGCPGPQPSWAAPCTDHCGTSEYALACGGIGPTAPTYVPPPACRFAGAVPAGIAYYCCPCK
jgi:hypothetical protein